MAAFLESIQTAMLCFCFFSVSDRATEDRVHILRLSLLAFVCSTSLWLRAPVAQPGIRPLTDAGYLLFSSITDYGKEGIRGPLSGYLFSGILSAVAGSIIGASGKVLLKKSSLMFK
jgi:glycerol uptake facilitator-like aquaporin